VTGKYRHSVYGIVIESEFRLSTIDDALEASDPPAVSIDLAAPEYFQAKTGATVRDSNDWLHHSILPDGSIYIRADEVFETIVSANGRHAACLKAVGADERSFEAYLLNFVLSTSLSLQGEEPLHATVVDLGGRSIGLLGDSGAGKSTLAAFLISQGATLVTDDMLRLTFTDGQAFAHQGPRRLKLFDEAALRLLPETVGDGHWNAMSGKVMVKPHERPAGQHPPQPLCALFWLDEPKQLSTPDAVSSTRLAGLDLARALFASTMNTRLHAPDRLTRQLRFAERVARVLPVYALRYARSYSVLGQVARELGRRTAP
jgi:hypothetical protein